MTVPRTREEALTAATTIHDQQDCGCDRRYLMSCPRMATALLSLAKRPTEETP